MTTFTGHLGDPREPVSLDIECYEATDAPCRPLDLPRECVVCDATEDITGGEEPWIVTRYEGDCDGTGPNGEIPLSDGMEITVTNRGDYYTWTPALESGDHENH